MRTLHRWIMTVAAVLFIYVAGSGILIQLIDLNTLLRKAPATDPNMQSMREGIMGPPGFAVISTSDYSAARLPANADPLQLLAVIESAARRAAPSEEFNWVELRMDGGIPVGIVAVAGANTRHLEFNAVTGELIGGPKVESPFAMFSRGPSSAHDLIKGFHRGDVIGQSGAWISFLVGASLFAMTVSGLVMYFKMLIARRKIERHGWFWK